MNRKIGGFSKDRIDKATNRYFMENYDKEFGSQNYKISDVIQYKDKDKDKDSATKATKDINDIFTKDKNQLSDLAGLMAIYKALMLEDDIGDTKRKVVKVDGDNIPYKTILKYVLMKIREIQRTNPHPELTSTILYYFDIIGFDTLFNMMGPYLDQITEQFNEQTKMSHDPDAITTYLEKSLTQHETTNARDNDPDEKRRLYNIITHVPNRNNTYAYGTHVLNLLANHPWSSPNLIMAKHTYLPKLYNGTFGSASAASGVSSV